MRRIAPPAGRDGLNHRAVDARPEKWFDKLMSKQASIDVGAMIEGIRRWVETESPTSDKASVNRMIDLVQADVAGLPVKVERVPGREGFGDNLVVRNHAAGDGAGILLLSHIDTVHPIGTLAGPLPFRRDGDKLYGPGLFDMKGGAYLALR
jgi:glutamate carboxypeptidase